MKMLRTFLSSRKLQLAAACTLVGVVVLAGLQTLQARPAVGGPAPAADSYYQAGAGPATSRQESAAPVTGASFTGDVRAKEKVILAAKIASRVKQMRAEVGDVVKKGDLVIELDHDLLDIQVTQGEAALTLAEAQLAKLVSGSRKEQIAIAEAGLASAQAELDLMLEGGRKEAIAAAKSALKAAQAQLDLALAGASAEALEIAQLQAKIAEAADVLRARSQEVSMNSTATQSRMSPYDFEMAMFQEKLGALQVQLAQAQLKAVRAAPRPQEIGQLEAAVEGAKAQLNLVSSPKRALEIEKQRAAVEIARQQLELAKNPNTDNDLAAAAAQVLRARALLNQMRSNRDDALLAAPFDGIISARNSGPGGLVMPGDAIVTMISTRVDVVFNLGEADYQQVTAGKAVTVTTAAYPGQVFSGTVRAIAPQADPATRRFNVYVNVADGDMKLKPGMFINVAF